MKIPSSTINYLMRAVVGRRMLHMGVDDRYKLGLHVGDNYIGVCLFNRTHNIVVPNWYDISIFLIYVMSCFNVIH